MFMVRVLWLVWLACTATDVLCADRFSEQAWQKIAPIYSEILVHPFNRELQRGTLAKSRFDFYSTQDQIYLKYFAKSLMILASKLDDKKDQALVLKFAEDCLHEGKSPSWSETEAMSPANVLYTNFLLTTAAYKSREELAAALLPCFWIYQRLANDLKRNETLPNSYDHWIKLYSGASYEKSVQLMLDLVDRLANDITPVARDHMLDSFVMASRMEWYFWDNAYHLEKWKP